MSAEPSVPAGQSELAEALALPAPRRAYFDLFLISFVILFFELACIRWFGSTVIFLTFFTNIVLMACFLGMSVGCLAASRKRDYIQWVIPLATATALLAWALFLGYNRFSRLTIDVGQQASPQLIYFGTEYRPTDPTQFVVPLWAIAGLFFTLIALMFAGLGQVMGRAFDALPNRVAAYTTNILGSLAGILAFGAASWFQTPPLVWFTVAILIVLYFVRRWTALQIVSQVALLVVIALTSFGVGERGYVRGVATGGQVHWSPYYKVYFQPQTRDINTNNISHQQMLNIRQAGPAYALPHLLNMDARGKNSEFRDVLIIGAGSGNDVSAALQYGAEQIDAVEIDPVIHHLGFVNHPDAPYLYRDTANRQMVHTHLTDGRRFLKQPGRKYDMAVYALVDSLVLHSGYSSLRLESYLFTREAFQDVKSRLKPDGVFVMYNYYRQGWVIGRLAQMAREVFGSEPVVISMPYQEKITPDINQANCITFLLVGNGPNVPAVKAVREKFAQEKFFWLHERPDENEGVNGYRPEPPNTSRHWRKIGLTTVQTEGAGELPTDDWPFLYLKERRIPWRPSVVGMIVIGVLSLAILGLFAPVRSIRPNGQMFFLGAGFMLLETKGVVHMALLFGSTWVVNSVVFFAILVMILLSNLYVLALRPRRLWPYYLLLLAALAVNSLVPMGWFLGLSPAVRVVVSCAVIFVPIFFAGVIFATAFRDSRQPDVDYGSNIAGVILGGLSEYLSLVLGFGHLLLVAIGFYLLSSVLQPRGTAPAAGLAAQPA